MARSDPVEVVLRHGPLVAVVTLAGLVGALAVLLLQLAVMPRHQAEARLFVSSSSARDLSTVGEAVGDGVDSREVDRVKELATSRLVLDAVAARLGPPLTAAQLARRVRAAAQPGTDVLEVIVTGDSPADATRVADAVATELATVAGQVSPSDPPIRVTRLQRARPILPAGPDPVLTLGTGLLLGLVTGLLLAALREPRREPGWGRLAVR